MYCVSCGKAVPDEAIKCPVCGAPVLRPAQYPVGSQDTLSRIMSEADRAARELATAVEQLSRSVAGAAKVAADDPNDAVKRAAKKVKEELDKARDELEAALRKL